VAWENIDGTVLAAHIHVGAPGVPGAVVVTLFKRLRGTGQRQRMR
jgi:hypothetical protein